MKHFFMSTLMTISFGINFQANAGSKLQLDLTQLNASLNEEDLANINGSCKLQMDPVKVDLENINYDLSMQDNFFIIEGPGTKLNLDLKSFRKIFEQQKFNAVNTNINIKQGEYIKFDSEYFDVSLKAVKLNFLGRSFMCPRNRERYHRRNPRTMSQKSRRLPPQGVMTGLEDVIYRWANNLFFQRKKKKKNLTTFLSLPDPF